LSEDELAVHFGLLVPVGVLDHVVLPARPRVDHHPGKRLLPAPEARLHPAPGLQRGRLHLPRKPHPDPRNPGLHVAVLVPERVRGASAAASPLSPALLWRLDRGDHGGEPLEAALVPGLHLGPHPRVAPCARCRLGRRRLVPCPVPRPRRLQLGRHPPGVPVEAHGNPVLVLVVVPVRG